MVIRPGTNDNASGNGIPGARLAAVAAGVSAAKRRRPPAAVTVAKGGSPFGASAEAEARLGSEPLRRSRSIGQLGRKTYMTRRIRYLHLPLRRHAAAAAQQFDPPARCSDQLPQPGIISLARGQCRDAPAGHGGARPLAFSRGFRAVAPAPQQKGRDAGMLGGELQPAAGDKRQSPDLADHRDEAGGAQPFFDGPQYVLVARRADDDKARRVEPMRQEPRPVQIGPLQAPQHRPRAKAGEDAGDKAASGGAVLLVAALPEDLVHRAQGEAAARQGAVDRRDPGRQDPVASRLLDMPDSLAERGEGAGTRHILRKIMSHHLRKAHLLTCNYRLFAGARMSPRQAEPPGAAREDQKELAVCDMPEGTPTDPVSSYFVLISPIVRSE